MHTHQDNEGPLVTESRHLPSRDIFAKTIRWQRKRSGGTILFKMPHLNETTSLEMRKELIHCHNVSCVVRAMKQLMMQRGDIKHPYYTTKAASR